MMIPPRRGARLLRMTVSVVWILALGILVGCSDDDDPSAPPQSTPPVIQSISPDTVVIGTTAVIRGERFGSTRGSSDVLFGSRTAQSLTWSTNKILAVVPDNAASGNLSVVVGGEKSNNHPYQVAAMAPHIDALHPSTGEVGESVRIQGRLFGVQKRTGTVHFGEVEATTTAWTDTTIDVVVPQSATTGMVHVTARDLASNEVLFTVTSVAAPLIESVDPDSGLPGAAVVITGTGFGVPKGLHTGSVHIGAADATTTSWTDTRIEAIVPDDAVPGNQMVQVFVDDVPSNSYPFKVLQEAAPVVITRLEPARTTVSDIITIYGTGFRMESEEPVVTFQGPTGRIPTTITVWDEESMRVWVPQGAVDGPVTVQFGEDLSNEVFFSVAPRRITFTNDVKPLFQAKGCLGCHAGAGASGNLSLETKATTMSSGSDHGPVVILRNSAESIIVQKVGPNPPFGSRMPLGCTTNCMTDEEILILSDWIDQGGDN